MHLIIIPNAAHWRGPMGCRVQQVPLWKTGLYPFSKGGTFAIIIHLTDYPQIRYNQELFFYPNIQNIFHQAKMIVQRVYSAIVLFCVLGNYQIRNPNTIQSVF
jgi:hypothetical protein